MGPGRTALLHCRDSPETSERLLRKHVGDMSTADIYTTTRPNTAAETLYWDQFNNNKVSFEKASEILLRFSNAYKT